MFQLRTRNYPSALDKVIYFHDTDIIKNEVRDCLGIKVEPEKSERSDSDEDRKEIG